MNFSDSPDAQRGRMQTVRENLCICQTFAPAHWKSDIQHAIDIVDQYGSTLPGWSKYCQPEHPEPKS